MDLTADIVMAMGIAAGVGIRPFLPILLIGALARANVGIDVEGTDFAFIYSWPFLLAAVIGVVVLDLYARRTKQLAFEGGAPMVLLAIFSIGLGAIEAAAMIGQDQSVTTALAVGIPVGALCAALGFFTIRSLLVGARKRLDDKAAGALPLYAEGLALLSVGLSILFWPLAIVVIVFLLWLNFARRRRSGDKYAGLRILR